MVSSGDDSIGIERYLCLLSLIKVNSPILKTTVNTKQDSTSNIVLMSLLLENPECLMLDCNSDSNSEY